jgi:hypothetical protein
MLYTCLHGYEKVTRIDVVVGGRYCSTDVAYHAVDVRIFDELDCC